MAGQSPSETTCAPRGKTGSTAEVDFVWQEVTDIIPIEVKACTNSHLRSLHTFVNGCDRSVVAIRIWSGPLSIQDIKTPSPENKPFRLINLPFYYAGQLDKVIAKISLNLDIHTNIQKM